MNQIRRCIGLIGFALALIVWSAESVAWHKGAYHSDPEPWEVQGDRSGSAETVTAPTEPAEAIVVEFKIGDFVPPPRTITDVAALLDQHGQTNAAELARHRKIANAEPPADASDRKLAEFYRKRGVVRGALGQIEEQIRDLETALDRRFSAISSCAMTLILEHNRLAI